MMHRRSDRLQEFRLLKGKLNTIKELNKPHENLNVNELKPMVARYKWANTSPMMPITSEGEAAGAFGIATCWCRQHSMLRRLAAFLLVFEMN